MLKQTVNMHAHMILPQMNFLMDARQCAFRNAHANYLWVSGI